MKAFDKYTQNLKLVSKDGDTFIRSYSTNVARVDYVKQEVHQLGYWSVTTQKHINYATSELGFELIK